MVWSNTTKNSLRTIGSYTGDELSTISDDSIVYGRAFGDYTFDDTIGNIFNLQAKNSATYANQTKN